MTARATIAIASTLATCAAAQAQWALYSNGSADPNIAALSTGGASASGVPAPLESWWSELQADSKGTGTNAVAGFAAHRLLEDPVGAYRVADDFFMGDDWVLTRLDVFVYQTGFDGPSSPIAGATVRIWWNPPDAPESVLLFGDTVTNRLVDVQPTNVYRVFNSVATPAPEQPTAARRIWRVSLDIAGAPLPQGGGPYWLDWQFESDNPEQEVFAVPATIAGTRETTNANAVRLDWRDAGGWRPAIDTGKPAITPDVGQDFAFILIGEGGKTPPPCVVDWDHNGVVNSTDVAAFINSWFEDQVTGGLTADFDANGVVNSTDVSAFINDWFGSQPYCS